MYKRGFKGRGSSLHSLAVSWHDSRLDKFPKLQADSMTPSSFPTPPSSSISHPASLLYILSPLGLRRAHFSPSDLWHRHIGALDSSQIGAVEEGDPKVSRVSWVNLSGVRPEGGGGGGGEGWRGCVCWGGEPRDRWRARERGLVGPRWAHKLPCWAQPWLADSCAQPSL